jgi:GTPase SAR1 family protein
MNDIELNTKVVIIGNSGVGKTSICNRYFNNKFDESTMPTYGTSYVNKVLQINNKRIKMMVEVIPSFGTQLVKIV